MKSSKTPLMPPSGPEKRPHLSGRLYVVATPIGHMGDITLRAIDILAKVDLIAAEDTRQSGRLLKRHGIKKRLVSYHEHNETERTPSLIKQLKSGKTIALLSNAGTPVVSDPGYRLIKAAAGENIDLVPVPGVSALTTALSVCGLPTDAFVFVGFLPRKKGPRLTALKALEQEHRTMIFYESPRRILALMEELLLLMGRRQAVLGREMTKRHEEFVRGMLPEIVETLKRRAVVKGECTLIVSGRTDLAVADTVRMEAEIRQKLLTSDDRPADLARALAKKYNLSRKTVYAAIIKIKNKLPD